MSEQKQTPEELRADFEQGYREQISASQGFPQDRLDEAVAKAMAVYDEYDGEIDGVDTRIVGSDEQDINTAEIVVTPMRRRVSVTMIAMTPRGLIIDTDDKELAEGIREIAQR